jgi:hypothetical protein
MRYIEGRKYCRDKEREERGEREGRGFWVGLGMLCRGFWV